MRATTLRSVSCASPAVVGYTGVRRSGSGSPSVDHLELRMHDLAAEVAVAHFAVDAHTLPGRERFLLVGIEVEEAQHELRARAALGGSSSRRQTSWRRGRYWISVLTTVPSACSVDARRECGERHDARVVLVAQRQVQDKVLVARDAEPDQLVRKSASAGLGGSPVSRRAPPVRDPRSSLQPTRACRSSPSPLRSPSRRSHA